ncbi:hypothetical protein FACS1894132_09830 [Clostridia bacterium]|nr:hypothetical protein FACS1894132_09830 [Clostridia bacterium]
MKNQNYKSDYDVIINEIKALDIKKFVEYNGLKIRPGNFIVCPFHVEKSASLKLYEHSFYCFGCGCGGDIINFAMKLNGTDFKETVEKLKEDFYL